MKRALLLLLAGCADFSTLSQDYSPWCPADGGTFCDGFEHGLGAWEWDTQPSAGTLATLDATAHSGTHGLVFSGPGRNLITVTLTGAGTALRVFARGSGGTIVFGSAVTVPASSDWICVEAGSGDAGVTLSLGITDGGEQHFDDVALASTKIGCD